LTWPVSPSTFRKGANSGGPPDSSDRIQSRLKSLGLKGSNSRPSLARAKEKLTGLSQRASGLRQHCELEPKHGEYFTSPLISFLPSQLLLCGIGLWQSGRWGKPGGPPRSRRKPSPGLMCWGFLLWLFQGKWSVGSLSWSSLLPMADRSRAAILHCAHPVP